MAKKKARPKKSDRLPPAKTSEPAGDWRKLPRKPAESKRTANISLRVTTSQREALTANARESGRTLVDFILVCCGVD